MTDKVDPATVITATVGTYAVPGRTYPHPLPPELAPWHVYTADGGHSLLVLLDPADIDSAVPAPVRTVLRHQWTITPTGMIHAPLPNDPVKGLLVEPDDEEHTDNTEPPTLHRRAVGELYNPRVTQWPEASQWTLSESGVELVIFYSTPTTTEVEAIKSGRARFALLPGDHALVLAHRFDPLEWADTPWQAVRQTNNTAGLVESGPDGRLIVSVLMVDAATGIVRAIRQTTWSPRFVAAVRTAIATQLRNTSTDAQGATEITGWYRRYPSTTALVAAATINSNG